MDYVDGHVTGWTELRVHGVAGTAPEAMLEHPDVARVAGDEAAGFFRRLWEARSTSADTALQRTEAYSWGRLTSGDNTRALWLLLLPFMLLNVAFFMTPCPRTPQPPAGARLLDRLGASLLRLLALSFTATFALTAVTVAMDLVGWQCAAGRAPDADVCGAWWLAWLGWSGLDRPGRQLAVTALLPLVVIGVLWLLGNATWLRLERVDVAQTVPDAEVDVATPLEDRALWNGRAAVRRLRALHVAAGLAVPGVFAVAPLPPAWGNRAVLVVLLVLLAVTAVLTSLSSTGHRDRPRQDDPAPPGEGRSFYRWWPRVTLLVTAVGLVLASVTPAPRPVGAMPWLAGTVQWLFAAQGLVLLLLAAICAGLRRHAEDRGPARCAPVADEPVEPVTIRPAWGGLALPGIALLAWVLAGGFSAGVILRAAQILGTPVAPGQPGGTDRPLVVATAYSWAAVAGLVLVLVAAARIAVTVAALRRPSDRVRAAVDAAYGAATGRADPDRRNAVVRAWHEAETLSREAERALGFLLLVAVGVVGLGVVGFLTVGAGLLTDWSLVVAVANAVITVFVVALLGVGRQAYRNPATRRTVGIAWDLGTFWPRAVHPLAPPCYAERAIPDLMVRMRHLTARGRVLLSCHSQGSVLGAAVLLQAETPVSARTAFLTYGSPLARLYGRFFPAYFSATALGRLGNFVGPTPGASSADARGSWRWRNLHRPSDPIGGAVFCTRAPVFPQDTDPAADPGDVDRPLVDPAFARPPGDPSYPPVLGHSNYFADPAFAATADALRAGTIPRVPAGA